MPPTAASVASIRPDPPRILVRTLMLPRKVLSATAGDPVMTYPLSERLHRFQEEAAVERLNGAGIHREQFGELPDLFGRRFDRILEDGPKDAFRARRGGQGSLV